MGYVEITICQWACDKERVLLGLFFANEYASERLDIVRKLEEISGIRALGSIAISAEYSSERLAAMQAIGRVGGNGAAVVLGEVAKHAEYASERQTARDLIMQC